MVFFENSVHNLEKVFKTSLKIHRWIHRRTCLKAQWFLARAFSFFAHDPHAEATHPRKGVVLIIVCFSCRYDRLPICLDSVKKFQIPIFSSLVPCKPGHDVHKFPQKSLWFTLALPTFWSHCVTEIHLPQWPSTALHRLCWCTCAPSQKKTGAVGPHKLVSGGSWVYGAFLVSPLVKALSTYPGDPCFYTPAACSKQCCSPLPYAYLNKASNPTWYADKGCK